ncbi:MAG: 16S rRNA (cytosine(1402)-N(4))-methyltransferase RsmH, partial [Mycoplasmataceae bacterium]|nr:16S rRNA (cytosine(1402)-N(4))-methyltransferase RsmH [Mycoplasmataceae bacterium]
MEKHYSVMLNKVIKALNVKPNGIYVDLTLGRGGHSKKILEKLDTGLLISFDKDIQAIKESGPRLEKMGTNFKLVHSDYKNIKSELDKLGINQVDGILADIGVSSPQLDETERGFSYSKDARLDMRMNQKQGLDAHIIINEWSEIDIANILRDYADVMLYKRVAKGIVAERPI